MPLSRARTRGRYSRIVGVTHRLDVSPPRFFAFRRDKGFLPWSDHGTGPPCRYGPAPEEEGKGENMRSG